MIRRPPTRIEMKLEDIHEYEKVKREVDLARRAANKAAAAATGASSSSEGAAAAAPKVGYSADNPAPLVEAYFLVDC